MNRRDAIHALGAVVTSTPTAEQIARNPILAQLKVHGWAEGTNLTMERRYAEWKSERLPGLAGELVRRRADLLMTTGPEATLAAARATRTIPILFNAVVWPLEQGLIDSFARPGRNVTGIAYYTGVEVTNKRLEYLRAVARRRDRGHGASPTSRCVSDCRAFPRSRRPWTQADFSSTDRLRRRTRA